MKLHEKHSGRSRRGKAILLIALCAALVMASGCARKNNYANITDENDTISFELVDLKGDAEWTTEYAAGTELTISAEDLYGNAKITITADGASEPIVKKSKFASAKTVTIEQGGTYVITVTCSKRTSGIIRVTGPGAVAEEEAEAEAAADATDAEEGEAASESESA